MAERENAAVVRDVYDALNRRDLDRLAGLFADDYVLEGDVVDYPVRGPEGARQYFGAVLTGLPDAYYHLEDSIAAGDVVVQRWTFTGTHDAPWRGLAPTGRRVSIRGCTVSRLRGGKLARMQVYWDAATMLRQLGALPRPAEGALAAHHRERAASTADVRLD